MQSSRWCLAISCRFAVAAILVSTMLLQFEAQANDDVARLKKVQAKIQIVVSKVMPACVAISDGLGAGSGVIISPDGIILTAGHVITESSIYEVILPSGQTVKARALGKNLGIDAGMLKLINPPAGLPHVEIENSKKLKISEWVVSLGHSGGFEIGRTPPVRTGRILQISADQIISDAVLIGGDSGGPLFNLDGKLIGIHSSIGDSVAENRHVTMAAFAKSWDRMRAGETWGALPKLENPIPTNRRGVIGVRVDLKATKCRIRVVNPGSPAEEAGIQTGDIVLQFENTKIDDGRHLIEVIKRFSSGDICEMTVLRNTRMIELEVQLR